jgi:hypothetical protein
MNEALLEHERQVRLMEECEQIESECLRASEHEELKADLHRLQNICPEKKGGKFERRRL